MLPTESPFIRLLLAQVSSQEQKGGSLGKEKRSGQELAQVAWLSRREQENSVNGYCYDTGGKLGSRSRLPQIDEKERPNTENIFEHG
ncbi:hypothetical protein HZH68_006511 [Vespula germanica]|uniref:Uncharacterized protein n=1 Tax=Vespula germanica TaxID=30212 RepID=A0A834KBN5_VESGE|nr:hypothetical protein HZH68_006511 [Vespula germanica]